MIQSTISMLCALALIGTTVLSPFAFAQQTAQQTAEKYKMSADQEFSSAAKVLSEVELSLIQARAEAAQRGQQDFSKLASYATVGAGVATTFLLLASLYSAKAGGEGGAWMSLGLILYGAIGLAATNVLGLLDLWMSPNANADELSAKISSTVESLQALRGRVDGASQDQLDFVITKIQNIDIEATAQEKQESRKSIMSYTGFALAAASTGSMLAITQGALKQKNIWIPTLLAVGSAVTFVGAALTNEDREQIIEAVDRAIESVQQARLSLGSN